MDEGDADDASEADAKSEEDDDNERGNALQVLTVPGGTLSQYFNEKKQDLYVVAKCDSGHGPKACRKQRTLLERKSSSGSLAQGRPLGVLLAWLKAGRIAGCNCTKDHGKCRIAREDRQEAREELKLLDGAAELLADERPQRPGEPEEPWRQP